jgi:hypothetical protein
MNSKKSLFLIPLMFISFNVTPSHVAASESSLILKEELHDEYAIRWLVAPVNLQNAVDLKTFRTFSEQCNHNYFSVANHTNNPYMLSQVEFQFLAPTYNIIRSNFNSPITLEPAKICYFFDSRQGPAQEASKYEHQRIKSISIGGKKCVMEANKNVFRHIILIDPKKQIEGSWDYSAFTDHVNYRLSHAVINMELHFKM